MLSHAPGQLVDEALHEIERAVEIRPGVVAALIDQPDRVAIVVRLEIHGLAIGKRRVHDEVAEAPVEPGLQGIVARRISYPALRHTGCFAIGDIERLAGPAPSQGAEGSIYVYICLLVHPRHPTIK